MINDDGGGGDDDDDDDDDKTTTMTTLVMKVDRMADLYPVASIFHLFSDGLSHLLTAINNLTIRTATLSNTNHDENF